MAQNFCTSCGARLESDANFCTGCGARIGGPQTAEPAVVAPPVAPTAPPVAAPAVEAPTAPPVAPPPPTSAQATPPPQQAPYAAPAERILSVLGGVNMKSGLLKRTSYVVVMTDRRLVFAQQTAEMLKQIALQARDDAKRGGKGFFGQWSAQLAATMQHAERYRSMHPDQALAETPGNWQLDRSVITGIKVKVGQHSDENTNATPDRLIIKTTGGKHVFEMQTGSGLQARKAFSEAGLT